ncbi:PH domain-containing protein [Candidatus Uhrbacteria bacterium]|nr:PH domain-containing protein [Candidatus Uhrbacteria bacterium]
MILHDLIRLNPGERIVMKLRRHFLTFLGQVFLVAIIALVPLGAGYVINAVHPEWLRSPIGRPGLVLLASAFYLNVWMFALAVFVDYYLDVWIVTDRRIIDIQQTGLFSRTVAELEISRIQDATSEVKGIVPTILNYGDVHIQTAGEKERFLFEQVPNPDRIRQRLVKLIEGKGKGTPL